MLICSNNCSFLIELFVLTFHITDAADGCELADNCGIDVSFDVSRSARGR